MIHYLYIQLERQNMKSKPTGIVQKYCSAKHNCKRIHQDIWYHEVKNSSLSKTVTTRKAPVLIWLPKLSTWTSDKIPVFQVLIFFCSFYHFFSFVLVKNADCRPKLQCRLGVKCRLQTTDFFKWSSTSSRPVFSLVLDTCSIYCFKKY